MALDSSSRTTPVMTSPSTISMCAEPSVPPLAQLGVVGLGSGW
jgi:hypothetical protein